MQALILPSDRHHLFPLISLPIPRISPDCKICLTYFRAFVHCVLCDAVFMLFISVIVLYNRRLGV